MTTDAFCPCCGHNLTAERPVALGLLRFDPRGAARFGAHVLRLTSQQHLILGSLVAARGAIVSRPVLNERIGYEGDGNVLDVQLARLRATLRRAGAPDGLFESARRRGVRLAVELLEPGRC